MKFFLKIFLFVFVFNFFSTEVKAQQDDMFKQKKERKRLWRRWKPNREMFNPYLKKTASKKTSNKIAKGTKREMRKQKRAYQKELKRTRRKKGIAQPPKD